MPITIHFRMLTDGELTLDYHGVAEYLEDTIFFQDSHQDQYQIELHDSFVLIRRFSEFPLTITLRKEGVSEAILEGYQTYMHMSIRTTYFQIDPSHLNISYQIFSDSQIITNHQLMMDLNL